MLINKHIVYSCFIFVQLLFQLVECLSPEGGGCRVNQVEFCFYLSISFPYPLVFICWISTVSNIAFIGTQWRVGSGR